MVPLSRAVCAWVTIESPLWLFQAVEKYTASIDEDGSSAPLLSNRSAAYVGLGQFNKALEDAEACLDLRPGWPKGWEPLVDDGV